MKRYVLLRNHRTEGPYLLEDLKKMVLRPTDMVWVEGESNFWKYPGQLYELVPLLSSGPPKKENRLVTFGIARWPQLLLIAALLVAGLASKSVFFESKDNTGTKSALNESLLPEKNAPNQHDIHNALGQEYVLNDTVQNKPIKKTRKNNTATFRKLVSVKTNDYKVGLFGGINNLEITVVNNAPASFRKITVQVDYLKPNGTVLLSKNINFLDINPRSTKTIAIESSKRGVKIRPVIKSIYAKEYEPASQSL